MANLTQNNHIAKPKIEDASIDGDTLILLIDGENPNAYDQIKIHLSYLMDFIDEKGLREYTTEDWNHRGECSTETGTTQMESYLRDNLKEASSYYLSEEAA